MTYNLSAINSSSTTLEFMRNVNTLTDNMLGNGWSLVFFIVLFIIIYTRTTNYKRSMIGAGFLSFIISIITLAMQLVDWYIVIMFLVITLIGVILSFDKDQGV